MYTCPIVEAELLNWALKANFGARRLKGLRQFLGEMSYLNVVSETAKVYASAMWIGTPTLFHNDKWIASLALQHGLVILTCDSDFLRYDFLKPHVIYLNAADYF